jgi:hypothetical protein
MGSLFLRLPANHRQIPAELISHGMWKILQTGKDIDSNGPWSGTEKSLINSERCFLPAVSLSRASIDSKSVGEKQCSKSAASMFA